MKIGSRLAMYKALADEFDIQSALYPGCHIDITPSQVIPQVTYVDNFRGTIKFFSKIEEVERFIELSKTYAEKTSIRFLAADYNDLDIEGLFDLIISQYAGFVGQSTKKYLKQGGILLCNDSHGDATLAHCDDDYELIAVINNNHVIDSSQLDKYFRFKRQRDVDLDKVKETMKGPKYKYNAENYIYRLVASGK